MRSLCRRNREGGCRGGGFTLVELLVVIAIIAILITMLMPTMGRAREMVRDTLCLNNHKLMVGALTTYESEHGAFPFNYHNAGWGFFMDDSHQGTYGKMRWALGELAPYLPGGRVGLTDLRNLDEGEFPACYICPSADFEEIYLYNPSDKYHACYWTNFALRCNRGWMTTLFDDHGSGAPPGGDGIDSGGLGRIHGRLCAGVGMHWRSVYLPRMSSVPMVEQTVFTGDTNDIEFVAAYGSLPGEWFMAPGWGWCYGSLGFKRHRGKLQMSYLDGSARAVDHRFLADHFGIWGSHEVDELTGDFMVQFPPSMSCNGSGMHKLPEPVVP